ncbi:hypothetical protein Sjap_004986 [Stephania japonica]|uniref:Uncharacterized protein n=1 Tax=Stephania japonica TaxID=461633 RepID=A0AAP0K4R3_9MAGN
MASIAPTTADAIQRANREQHLFQPDKNMQPEASSTRSCRNANTLVKNESLSCEFSRELTAVILVIKYLIEVIFPIRCYWVESAVYFIPGKSVDLWGIVYKIPSFQVLTMSKGSVLPANSYVLEDTADLVQLSFFNEPSEYEKDGIDWKNVHFEDNQECLNLIELQEGTCPGDDMLGSLPSSSSHVDIKNHDTISMAVIDHEGLTTKATTQCTEYSRPKRLVANLVRQHQGTGHLVTQWHVN